MKSFLCILFSVFLFASSAHSQCSPNPAFTFIGVPGVYPPVIPIPSLPNGINDGAVGVPYSQILTLIVLEDTTMDISFLLDSNVVNVMNLAGISTIMTLDVNHVVFDVQDLPNGLNYTCDQSNCQYLAGVDGCILLDGTPTQGGNFTVPVNMTINMQIPPITDPLLGTTIFPGMAVDLPAFAAQEYDLFIDGGTFTVSEINQTSSVFPNPTSTVTTLQIGSVSDVKIYNVLGKIVFDATDVKGKIKLSKSNLGVGIFYITVSSESKEETLKLIIKQ